MKPLDAASIPNRWGLMMKKYGITARSVSIKAGVNLPHFYNVLKGRASPTLEYVSKIEKILANEITTKEEINIGTMGEPYEPAPRINPIID